MKNRDGIRYLRKGYSSYQGRVHNKYADSNVEAFKGVSMPIDGVTAGRVVIGKPADTFEEEQERLKKSARSY